MKLFVFAVVAVLVASATAEEEFISGHNIPCAYLDSRLEVTFAYNGESFNDGCNNCRCADYGMALCGRMYCPHKCEYRVAANEEYAGTNGWYDIGTTYINKQGQVCECQNQVLGYSGFVCQ
eukprot:sb/3476034/